jgi:succinoglycan biosynthesis protein ExoA
VNKHLPGRKEQSMPQAQPHVSIIVPCRNEIRHIRAFLASALRQDLGGMEMEILIADGMSDDGTRQALEEFAEKFPAIRILDNPEQIVSTGLNRAIRKAQGEIIVRMDAHTTYAPNYIRSCVEVLNETGADNVGGPALTRAEGYVAQAIALAFHTPFASGGAKFRDTRYTGPVDTVMYGCWRKSTLERIGLFDEELVRSQDYELNARLISLGRTLWQSPKIIYWYHPRTTFFGLFRQYFQYGFWKVAALRKNGRQGSWRNLVPGSCLLAGIILPLCAAAANFGGLMWWRNIFLADWFALTSLYLTASFASAFLIAKRKGWRYLPCMPVVFAVYHLSYALGFILAFLVRPAAVERRPNAIRKVLTAITR